MLDGLGRGLTYREIAEELGLSYDTVKYHVSNMLAKAGVTGRDDLVAFSAGRPARWRAAPAVLAWAICGTAVAAVVVAGIIVLAQRGSGGDPAEGDAPATLATATRPGGSGAPAELRQLARDIQAAVDGRGSYRITAEQENLVLPQWGGSDGGSVEVGAKGAIMVANLARTGDGQYSIVFRDGETLFIRGTCREWARIPGGGRDVLAPFVIAGNRRIAEATNLRLSTEVGTSGGTLLMTMAGLGEVEIAFSGETNLPTTIRSATATNNGKPLRWEFDNWGVAVAKPLISASYDRGPGGNPC